jgi:hypothetical protein
VSRFHKILCLTHQASAASSSINVDVQMTKSVSKSPRLALSDSVSIISIAQILAKGESNKVVSSCGYD